MTAQELLDRFNITAEIKKVNHRPDGEDWMKGASHFKVTLSAAVINRDGVRVQIPHGTYDTYYSQGPGVKTLPDTAQVFGCLVSNAMAFRFATDMADFLEEFGYGETSSMLRKGMKAYDACKETAAFLRIAFHCSSPEEFETILSEYDPE